MAHQLSEDEVRKAFLEHVSHMVDYWSRLPDKTKEEACDGLAFSILVALDGGSLAIPGFKVTPHVHPEDKEFCIREGENWYPDDVDIAGDLHDYWYSVRRGNAE